MPWLGMWTAVSWMIKGAASGIDIRMTFINPLLQETRHSKPGLSFSERLLPRALFVRSLPQCTAWSDLRLRNNSSEDALRLLGLEQRPNPPDRIGLWLSGEILKNVSPKRAAGISWWLPPVIWPEDENTIGEQVNLAIKKGRLVDSNSFSNYYHISWVNDSSKDVMYTTGQYLFDCAPSLDADWLITDAQVCEQHWIMFIRFSELWFCTAIYDTPLK